MNNNAEQSRFPLPLLRPRPAFIRACLCAKDVGGCVHLLTFLSPFACERPTREMSPFFPSSLVYKEEIDAGIVSPPQRGPKGRKTFCEKEGENRKEVATIFQRPNFLRKAKVFLKKKVERASCFVPEKSYKILFLCFSRKRKAGSTCFSPVTDR